MTKQQEQLIALAGVFTAAQQVNKLARTGTIDTDIVECLLNSLLITHPKSTLAVYGGNDDHLIESYQIMAQFFGRTHMPSRDIMRYALSLLMLERKLSANKAMLSTISERLTLIQNKANLFGIMHENVLAACGTLYQDTISTFSRRIQVMGDVHFLQQPSTASYIRTLLLTGIRSAMLWQQLGGRRWHLLFRRKQLLNDLSQRLNKKELG